VKLRVSVVKRSWQMAALNHREVQAPRKAVYDTSNSFAVGQFPPESAIIAGFSNGLISLL
jgi:hypothetical protein